MPSSPMFSIIVPVYNAAGFADRLIGNLKSQPFDSFEVLLADDGSSDRSAAMLTGMIAGDDRFSFIPGVHAGSPAAPRNRALRRAAGRYIIFLDADDELLPESMINFAAALAAHDYPDVLCGRFSTGFHDDNGVYLESNQTMVFSESDGEMPGARLLELLEIRRHPLACNCILNVYRREFLLEHRLFQSEDLILGEDHENCPKIFFYAQRVAALDRVHYRYIRRPDSITTGLPERALADAGRVAVRLRRFYQLHEAEMSPGMRRFWCKYALEPFLWFFFNPMYLDRIPYGKWRRAWKAAGFLDSPRHWKENFTLFRHASLFKKGFLPFLMLAALGWRTPGLWYSRLGRKY